MNNDTRSAYIARDRILNLLSDTEVACVSTAETAPHLSDGDDYIDLRHLERGVQTAAGTAPAMGHVLPRKAVREDTWSKIVTELRAPKELSHDDIAVLAYLYWEQRGRPFGSPEVDWTDAVNSLRDRAAPRASTERVR